MEEGEKRQKCERIGCKNDKKREREREREKPYMERAVIGEQLLLRTMHRYGIELSNKYR